MSYKPLNWYCNANYAIGGITSQINSDFKFLITHNADNGCSEAFIVNQAVDDMEVLMIGSFETLTEAKQTCENYQFRELA